MARVPVTALHARLSGIGTTISTSVDATAKAIAEAGGNDDWLRKLNSRIDDLEKDVQHLKKAHYLRIYRLLVVGIDARDRKFVQDEPLAASLIAAGYPDVKSVAMISAGRGKRPSQKLSEDLEKIHKTDPGKYGPPPAPNDLELLYDICAETEKSAT
ncbi:hypothetical protein [Maliponia aquimaris]|uniref:Uncharacterized protein n=1 Tax=Maliponia aquimaris TaxID=1673631 RepID=A0A238L5C8_9RHOB|nr:hypothetical protein [Maliponia aquimaris]SMX50313.1 hypothetical protein MAA8898_04717 [Maliponia aquimaris]